VPRQSFGSTHLIALLTVSDVALPVLSVAGLNRARLFIRRQVVLSRADEPLEPVIWQSVTRPFGPTVSLNRVVPCSSFRIADAG
jgi:hypothetical protein